MLIVYRYVNVLPWPSAVLPYRYSNGCGRSLLSDIL